MKPSPTLLASADYRALDRARDCDEFILILKSCSEKRRIELLYAWAFHEAPPREKSAHARPRKRSIATLVKRAEKTGRSVSSVTMPDGTTLNFGEPEPADAENPWLADLRKATKQ